MTTTHTDVVILGGGHNGLVCAFYLARAGLKVTVLERRGVVGGAAVTEEFHPGFRNSTASYTVSLLNPRVIADIRAGRNPVGVTAYFAWLYDANYRHAAERTLRAYTPGDTFYEMLIAAHEGLDDEASHKLNARLVLLLSNHIGDLRVLREALQAARQGA